MVGAPRQKRRAPGPAEPPRRRPCRRKWRVPPPRHELRPERACRRGGKPSRRAAATATATAIAMAITAATPGCAKRCGSARCRKPRSSCWSRCRSGSRRRSRCSASGALAPQSPAARAASPTHQQSPTSSRARPGLRAMPPPQPRAAGQVAGAAMGRAMSSRPRPHQPPRRTAWARRSGSRRSRRCPRRRAARDPCGNDNQAAARRRPL
mmetsp:Transcript_97403/g.281010  ORF Transcript_97403/g.281010 Transcript_97403/m.281010 type:complete len:209 (+) Transcript_97403:204-830(+)